MELPSNLCKNTPCLWTRYITWPTGQILLFEHWMHWIWYQIAYLFNYNFVHNLKCALEAIKLIEILHTKGNKILKNINTYWISMLLQALKVFIGIQNHDFENGGRQWKCWNYKTQLWAFVWCGNIIESYLCPTYTRINIWVVHVHMRLVDFDVWFC